MLRIQRTFFSKAFYNQLRMSSTDTKKPLLALPSTAEETVKVDMNDTYKLKELGPVVINEDGTMSRINNWHEMNEIERGNVNRILLKRNRDRLAKLKEQLQQKEEEKK